MDIQDIHICSFPFLYRNSLDSEGLNNMTETLWYFAIGSMTHPVSLKQRKLSPLQSFPAKIGGFRLEFITKQGFATAVADENSSFHGVLHEMTISEMEQLDTIEAGYDRVNAVAYLYDGTTRECCVYTAKAMLLTKPEFSVNLPPAERYLDIIIAGCKHHNVDQAHITFLESVERIPRKKPEEFLRISDVDDKPTWTMEQVAQGDGKNGDGPYYMVVNGKVREYIGPKDYLVFKMMTQFNIWGGHYDLWNGKLMYDPKYGECESIDDMLREHCQCIEDFHVNFDKENGYFKTVAVVERRYREDKMTKTNSDTLWYFAIGSMTNSVALRQRKLSPVRSYPALLRGFRLEFLGQGGFASAVADETSSFHGVLHEMTLPQMEQLDTIEAGYDRVKAVAYLYDGTTRDCCVYTFNPSRLSSNFGSINLPPTERYLDIIIAGCKHHNVDQAHITYLESVERIPRKKPEEFLRISDVDDKPTWTMEQVAQGDGKNGPYYMVVNGKVREYIGPTDDEVFKAYTRFNVWGGHSDFVQSQMMYDPKYGECGSIDDMTREQCACIEDFHVNFLYGHFKTVAVVERRYRD